MEQFKKATQIVFPTTVRRVLPYVLSDLHGAELRAAHEAEMGGLGSFLRQGLTKLIPMIFALIGLAVNSSLCRLIPVASIHRGLE